MKMTSLIEKTDKVLHLKSKQGRSLRVVREHYLREDVPCLSKFCLADCASPDDLPQLSKESSHYLVPDCQTTKDFLEILEFKEITGVIVMQTVNHVIQHESGRRHHKRLQNLIRDPRKSSVMFFNEFQKYCYQPRKPGEDIKHWQDRNVFEGATWYFNHLAGQLPIIMLSDDGKIQTEFGYKTAGVYVMSLKSYLDKFWSDLISAHQLYESLVASLKVKSKGTEYLGYYPPDLLTSGLKLGQYIQGRLNVNKHNSTNEAYISQTHKKKDGEINEDIIIWGQSDRNRAIHGDLVAVEILPRSQWRSKSNKLQENENEKNDDEEKEEIKDSHLLMPTGKVVGILQRNWRDYVACFSQEETSRGTRKSDKVLVIPFDWRIPKIRISTSQVSTLKEHRIVVRIDSWEADSHYPNGHFVRSLGPSEDLETNINAILMENQISVGTFSEGIMNEMPTNTDDNPWVMDDSEIKKRRDLRDSHLIFSIDPIGCEDVDDTLSVKKLPNGNLELGVHIADVTHFVKPNMLTDLEARSRSTTVYLADRRYDMLPSILSSDLCSLLSQVDRYSVSVIWELDAECKVVNVWYGKTVIRSAYKLFYEIAQQIYDGCDKTTILDNIEEFKGLEPKLIDEKIKELRWAVTNLMEIARKIKARRTLGGALELEGVEVRVQLDKSKNSIEDIIPKEPLEVHETIAECMIFANHWVAKKICKTFSNQALLRHHPMPRQEHFENLIKCAASKGFVIETQSNRQLAQSLDRCVDSNDPVVNKILRSLATQAMSNAAYFSTGSLPKNEFFHYGLALEFYTHFTSPIRRYADIIVHRLLMAAVEHEAEKEKILSNRDLQELAQHINERHRAAQHAQKESQQLYQSMFFKDRDAEDPLCVVDAVIVEFRQNGMLVFIPRYGIKGAVYLQGKDGQVVFLPTSNHPEWTSGSIENNNHFLTVHSILGSSTYRLFDHVTVRISVEKSHAHSSKLHFQIVSNSPYTNDDTGLQPKPDIIKIVGEQSKSAEDKNTIHLGANFDLLKAQYGQTPADSSFYSLFQSFHEMALLDI